MKFGTNLPASCFITHSLIQGSGLEPTLYIVMESNPHSMSDYINLMFKFADDTNLLLPQITDISVKAEILTVFRHL